MRWELVNDADDAVINVIELEDGADFTPPEGTHLVQGRDWPAPPPPPLELSFPKRVERLGVVRFTVTAGALSVTSDAVGVASAGRVSVGRYRVFFDPVDTALTYLCAASLRDAADLRLRITAKTANYVEVRTVNAAGTATDAAEIIITIDRVI